MRSDDEGMNDEVQNLTPSMIGRLMSGVSYCSHDSARSGIFHWASKLQASDLQIPELHCPSMDSELVVTDVMKR